MAGRCRDAFVASSFSESARLRPSFQQSLATVPDRVASIEPSLVCIVKAPRLYLVFWAQGGLDDVGAARRRVIIESDALLQWHLYELTPLSNILTSGA